MKELKQCICPHCGKAALNLNNCEFCGSMLVRFADKGIDLNRSPYMNDTFVFPGFANELKTNLSLQKRGSGFVSTDVYAPTPDSGSAIICSVFRPDKSNVWHDGRRMVLSDNHTGLYVTFNFDKYTDGENHKGHNLKMDKQLEAFKALAVSELFIYHHGYYADNKGEQRENITYAIDFGKDAEGAARIISDIINRVYGVKLTDSVSFYTNYGKYQEYELRGTPRKHRKISKFLKSPGFYLVLAAIVFILLKILEVL